MPAQRVGKYEIDKTIGRGSFSKVKIGIDTTTGTYVAVKVVDMHKVAAEGLEEQLKREIAVCKSLKHPNLVATMDVFQTENNVFLVMELVKGGELFDKIVSAKRFNEDTARKYFQQLIKGVSYCHKMNIAHRDLKPENLLVTDDDQLKVTDFGLSRLYEQGVKKQMFTTICGTPHYLAPEVLSGSYDGKKADVWACGIILYVMLAGAHPFDDRTVNGLFHKINNLQYIHPRYFSKDVSDLIHKILVVDPDKRATTDQIKNHPWFKIGFKDDNHEELQLRNESNSNAPLETVVAEKKNKMAVRTEKIEPKLNAFDITSKLMAGLMSPLVRTPKMSPQLMRRILKFMAEGSPDSVVDSTLKLLQEKNANVRRKDENIKAKIKIVGGVLDFNINIVPTMEFGLVMLEMVRLGGDTLAFQQLYREFRSKLSTEKDTKDTDDVKTSNYSSDDEADVL